LVGSVGLLAAAVLNPDNASYEQRHLMRELGAALVFVGLMSLWCNFNYDRSRTVHYLLTLFNLLIAAIHWYDYSRGDLPLTSPLFNSLAFVAFAALAIARSRETATN
jgi:hypothetical protein